MAFSIITWDRLEPLDQTSDLRVALGAPIADPLWLLHRQWQLGELDGNDAGTPIAVTAATAATPLSRYRAGDATAADWSPADTPLEPLIEAERVRGLSEQHRRLAAETGAQFVRMLTVAGQPTVVPAVASASPCSSPPSPTHGPTPWVPRPPSCFPAAPSMATPWPPPSLRAGPPMASCGQCRGGSPVAPPCSRWPGGGWRGTTGSSSSHRPGPEEDRARRHRPGTRGASSTGSRRPPARRRSSPRRSTTATSTGPTSTSTTASTSAGSYRPRPSRRRSPSRCR